MKNDDGRGQSDKSLERKDTGLKCKEPNIEPSDPENERDVHGCC